ncbi:MAG: HD domain-containing protein [Firmicutes bacterium]|nr:HD domain-containing protein [Bacillota bacterium]
MKLPESIKKALYMIEDAGYQGYIVGGCVRDALRGIEPHDYDITTSALPGEVKEIFKEYRVIETGIKHGTVTVLMKDSLADEAANGAAGSDVDTYPLEITTFRVEGEYLDGRRPSCVSFTRDLREDVARRDFTINAMAMDVRGETYDFFGGKEDLRAGIIRTVCNPRERFEEDALRIMRALRFASVTGFEIEQQTKDAIFECKELLLRISSERIREELVKLLLGKDVRRVLLEYWDVLAVIIPELAPMKDLDQKTHWHIYPVHEHTAVAVENAPNEDILRVAALLHDVGKPKCFFIDEKGVGHSYGHAQVGVDLSREILTRLKFDNESKMRILNLIKYHDAQLQPVPKNVKRALGKHGEVGFFDLLKLKRADNLAQSEEAFARLEYLDLLKRIAEEIIDEEQCFSAKDLAINGKDLIEMGMKPGKEIGEMLAALLEAVIEEIIPNDRAELLKFAQKIKK